MRYALISDIHANLEALRAVLADIDTRNVDAIICLGDIVGYGPKPREVLKLLRKRTTFFVTGNHDAVVAGAMSAEHFNDAARQAIEWTRRRMSPAEIRFFAGLPHEIEGKGFRATHGEFVVPQRFGYVFNEHDALASMASVAEPMLFIGHSHVPLVYVYRRNHPLPELLPPEDFMIRPDERYLVNIGSVGQPRDGDLRACYCIFDNATGGVEFQRVPYDVDTYRRAVIQAGLPRSPVFFAESIEQESGFDDFRPKSDIVSRAGLRVRNVQISPTGRAVKVALLLFILSMLCLMTVLLTLMNRSSEPPPQAQLQLGTGSLTKYTSAGTVTEIGNTTHTAPELQISESQTPEHTVISSTLEKKTEQPQFVDTTVVTAQRDTVSKSTEHTTDTVVSPTPPPRHLLRRNMKAPAIETAIMLAETGGAIPYCKPGNTFTVTHKTPLDYWTVELSDQTLQEVNFFDSGEIAIHSKMPKGVVRIQSAPLTFHEPPKRVLIAPALPDSDNISIVLNPGGRRLLANRLNSLVYDETLSLEIVAHGTGKFRIPPFTIIPEALTPTQGVAYIPAANARRLEDARILEILQLEQKKAQFNQMPTRWVNTARPDTALNGNGTSYNITAPAEIELFSPGVEIEWTKANLHRAYLFIETENPEKIDASVSLVISLPDRRFWQVGVQTIVPNKKLWLDIPNHLLPADLKGYALHLVIRGRFATSFTVKEAGVQRF